MNHKSGWCEDQISPKNDNNANTGDGKRIIVTPQKNVAITSADGQKLSNETDILIVASKLKQYIKDKHDLNTSADVMEELSVIVRKLADRAAIKAKSENRKTLMQRDF